MPYQLKKQSIMHLDCDDCLCWKERYTHSIACSHYSKRCYLCKSK